MRINLAAIAISLGLAISFTAWADDVVTSQSDTELSQQINRLVEQLDDDRAAERDAAETKLLELAGTTAADIDRFLEMPGPFEELGKLFHRYRIVRRDLGYPLVDLQGLLVRSLLEQCQPEAIERLGMVRDFLQGLAIGDGSFGPLLVPSGGVPLVHSFLEDVFSSGHSAIIT